MSGDRFDQISKSLASGAPRRRVFKILAIGTLAGLFARLGLRDSAEAQVGPGVLSPAPAGPTCVVTGGPCNPVGGGSHCCPGTQCAQPVPCCSGLCDQLTFTCLGACQPNGIRCFDQCGTAHPEVCCGGACTGPQGAQTCSGAPACAAIGQSCSNTPCCGEGQTATCDTSKGICVTCTKPTPAQLSACQAQCNSLYGPGSPNPPPGGPPRPPKAALLNACLKGCNCSTGPGFVVACCAFPGGNICSGQVFNCQGNAGCVCSQLADGSGGYCDVPFTCSARPVCGAGNTCAAGFVCVNTCCNGVQGGLGNCLPATCNCNTGAIATALTPGLPNSVGR